MVVYAAHRAAWSLLVLVAVALVTFALAYLAPTDPARAIAGAHASPADLQRVRHALALDRPVLDQFEAYAWRLVHGDLGYSVRQDRAVLPLLLSRLWATVELAVGALAVELTVGLSVGIACAVRPRSWFARVSAVAVSVLMSMPVFLVGYLLIGYLAFEPAVRLGIAALPIGGYVPFDPRYLVLPALTLGLTGSAVYARLTRLLVLAELAKPYTRTAVAKGASRNRAAWRHALPNVLAPIVAQVGLDLASFLGGVVVVEQIFGWPGIGRLAFQAVAEADVPLLTGTVLFAAVAVVLANLGADVAIHALDPRTRREGS